MSRITATHYDDFDTPWKTRLNPTNHRSFPAVSAAGCLAQYCQPFVKLGVFRPMLSSGIYFKIIFRPPLRFLTRLSA